MAISTLTALTTVFSIISSISQGAAERDRFEFQAAVDRQQAGREREIAAQDEEDFRREQSRKFAQRRAALGAGGFDPSTGTPLLAADDFITETELQALRIRSGGDTRFIRGNQQAALNSAAGGSALRSGFTRAEYLFYPYIHNIFF